MAKRRKQAEMSVGMTKGGAFGAIIMVFTAVFICVVAITLLYIINTTNTGDKDAGADTTSEIQDIENSLRELFPEKLEYVPTPELSDTEAFAAYNTKNAYYRECRVTRSDGENNVEQTLRILREGDHYNIKTIENGTLVETLISDGKQACIINEVTGGISYCPLGGEFTVENLVGLTDHSELVDLVSKYNAGDEAREQTGLASLSLSMFRNKATNMLVINLSRRDTGTREVYYYYLDYGCIYHSETSLGGSTVYSLNTTVFTVDTSEYKTADSFTFPQAPFEKGA